MKDVFSRLFILVLVSLLSACSAPDGDGKRGFFAEVQVAGADLVSEVKEALSSALPGSFEGLFATTPAIRILNPSEELLEFDARGILRWSAVAGADAYEVWAYGDEGLTQRQEFSKALSSRQYQFTELVGGRTYYIKLYYRVSGTWQELPAFTLRTTNLVTKARLSNPQDELESFGQGGTLRWGAVGGTDIYEVWIYRDAGLTAFAETSGPVRITQYQPVTLKAGTTYYVQVYARVNGEFKVGGALTLTSGTQLTTARILNAQEELDAFATDGLLRWSPVTGATAYELWIFTNPNSSETQESSGSLTARAYAPRTLQAGRVYYAQAYAKVNGAWQVGAPVRITTASSVTRARLSTSQEELESFNASTGTLRWGAVAGATAYEVWIFGNAGLGTVIESGAANGRIYQPSKLCVGGTYYVQVFALVNGQWTNGWATRLDVTQGTSSASCAPPAPRVSLSASAEEVFTGESVTLTWASAFAESCTASNDWSGSKATSGSQTVGPLTARSLFTLTCQGKGGTSKAETLVTQATTLQRAIAVTPSSIDFGLGNVGTESGARVITVRASGNASVTVAAVGIGGASSNQFPGSHNCGTILAGNTCEVSVRFKPTSSGAKSASISITHNAASNPSQVVLSGAAVVPSYSLSLSVIAEGPAQGSPLSFSSPNSGGYILDLKTPKKIFLARVFVRVRNAGGVVVAEGYTDANGRVVVAGLDPAQTYRVGVASVALTPDGLNVWVVNNRLPLDTAAQNFRDRYGVYWVYSDISTNLSGNGSVVSREMVIGAGYDPASRALKDDMRSSGPFLLLSYVVQHQAFLAAAGAPSTSLPALTILWSPTNRAAGDTDTYKYDEGIAGSSGAFFQGSGTNFIDSSGKETTACPCTSQRFIYLSGSQATESMELTSAVPVHELTHYTQRSTMRNASPGGPHSSSGEWQDFTLAQHEGFATGLALMVGGSSVSGRAFQFSTSQQSSFDALFYSAGTDYRKRTDGTSEGWFQEGSFTSLIWRLFDPQGTIKLSASQVIAPFYSTAWTAGVWAPSPWAYGTVLKTQNPDLSGAIDSLGSTLNITLAGNDHWGTNETVLGNRSSSLTFPIYTRITAGGSAQVCSTGTKAEYNKLSNRRYLRFDGTGTARTIRVTGTAGTVPTLYIDNPRQEIFSKDSNTVSAQITIPVAGTFGWVGECSVVDSPSASEVDRNCSSQSYTPPQETCWTVSVSN